jgi:hypothetical protein
MAGGAKPTETNTRAFAADGAMRSAPATTVAIAELFKKLVIFIFSSLASNSVVYPGQLATGFAECKADTAGIRLVPCLDRSHELLVN